MFFAHRALSTKDTNCQITALRYSSTCTLARGPEWLFSKPVIGVPTKHAFPPLLEVDLVMTCVTLQLENATTARSYKIFKSLCVMSNATGNLKLEHTVEDSYVPLQPTVKWSMWKGKKGCCFRYFWRNWPSLYPYGCAWTFLTMWVDDIFCGHNRAAKQVLPEEYFSARVLAVSLIQMLARKFYVQKRTWLLNSHREY